MMASDRPHLVAEWKCSPGSAVTPEVTQYARAQLNATLNPLGLKIQGFPLIAWKQNPSNQTVYGVLRFDVVQGEFR